MHDIIVRYNVKQNYKVLLTIITVFTLMLASGFILFSTTDVIENIRDQANRIYEGYTPEKLKSDLSKFNF